MRGTRRLSDDSSGRACYGVPVTGEAMMMVDKVGQSVGILVLGMHRSGTSALTGVLDELGLPAAGELLAAESYNEKGLFENKSVNAFHNRLLDYLGSRWDDPMPLSNGFVDTVAGQRFVAELAAIVRTELLETTAIFSVKDPRMCRFVPLWKAALEATGTEPRAIIALRHPLEVAGSLSRRDGFPRAKSLLLWLAHMLNAERETRALSRSFVSYDALLEDWRGTADRLALELGIGFPKERGRIEAVVDGFLTADLRHHAVAAQIGRSTRFDALVADAWDAFQALAVNRDDGEAMAELDRIAATLAEASEVLAPYVAWEFKALLDSRERTALLEEIERVVRAQNADYFAEIGKLTSAVDAEKQSAATALETERTAAETQRAEDRAKAAQAAEKAEATHRQLMASEQRSYRQAMEKVERELQALRPTAQQAADRAALFERRTAELEADAHRLRQEAHAHAAALNALEGSTAWRLTGPFRRAASALPLSMRWQIRRLAKAGWWMATPWRMPARLRFLREREQRPAGFDVASAVGSTAPPPSSSTPSGPRRATKSLPALGLFEVPTLQPRVSMVTDSINEGSLFGGVATALIFTALFAKRTGRRLRIVTRTQAPAAENVAAVFRAHGIAWTDNIEFVFADISDEDSRIETNADEIFVTTSWWTTRATRQSVADAQILYILQEDERMFYPFGDDYLACAETLSDRSIAKVINSGLLHRHLVEDGVIDEATPFFEPSFPSRIYFPSPDADADGKRNFFFYARPYNARNLYDRGVAVIETAIERGILDPALWNIHFVGKDLQPMQLAGGIEPILLQNMAWEDYAAFVRSVDLALTLMFTPHPSYPPLDVAACGGVAVTNRFGVKTDLSGYSRSIVCVDSELEALVEGLRQGVAQALDDDGRRAALSDSGIGRDWAASFAPVFDRLAESAAHVR